MCSDPIKVMLVDDQTEVRAMLAEVLTHLGYQAVEASDSYEALKLLSIQRPDIALIDVNLPGIDGLQLQECFKKEATPVPVILMSGSMDTEMMEKGMEAGALAFLTKPFDVFKLKELIDDLPSSKLGLKGEDNKWDAK